GRAARVGGARRDPVVVRPHRRAVPGRARGHVRAGGRHPRAIGAADGERRRARRGDGRGRLVSGPEVDGPRDPGRGTMAAFQRKVFEAFDLQPVLVPLYALVISVVIGGLLIAAIGKNPFDAYWALLRG